MIKTAIKTFVVIMMICLAVLGTTGLSEAFAEDAVGGGEEQEFWVDMPGGEDLFEEYISDLFGISKQSNTLRRAGAAGDSFEGELRDALELMKAFVHEIAQGTRSYTRLELGTGINAEDIQLVFSALKNANRVDLYWCDGITYTPERIENSDGFTYIVHEVDFVVLEEFQKDDSLHVDPTRVQIAQQSVANALSIVESCATLSDYEKLRKYKEIICEWVDYDYDAYNARVFEPLPEYTQHLINVFDGDPATKVVCAGYAEAFQYLCEKSAFSENINVIYVSGFVVGREQHAWNIVHMPNGKAYLVDVTWCDTEGPTSHEQYFMIGCDYGNVQQGYVVQGARRVYDYYVKEVYTEEDLTLSDHSYLMDMQGDVPTTDGFAYKVQSNGMACITGCTLTGHVDIPGEIDGYTVIGLDALLFADNSEITSVTLPASLYYFGENGMNDDGDRVFAYASNLRAIDVAQDNRFFRSVDGVLFSKDLSVLYQYPCGKDGTSYTVPARTKKLGQAAFAGARNLTDVTVSRSDTTWSTDSFESNSDMTVFYRLGGASEETVEYMLRYGLAGSHTKFYPEYVALPAVDFDYDLLEDGTAVIVNCNVTGSVRIPDAIDGHTVSCLESRLFYGISGVTEVTIPATVVGFGSDPADNLWDFVFSACGDLASIDVAADNPVFCSEDGVLYTKDKSTLIAYPCARAGAAYDVPQETLQIADEAFGSARNLQTLNLLSPDVVWDYFTFQGDGHMTVNYPGGGRAEATVESHLSLNLYAEANQNYPHYRKFEGLFSLPAGLTAIEAEAFEGCAFTCVRLPEGVRAIGSRAFADCPNLRHIFIPAETVNIADDAFAGAADLTIHSIRNSYARVYAENHGIAFAGE